MTDAEIEKEIEVLKKKLNLLEQMHALKKKIAELEAAPISPQFIPQPMIILRNTCDVQGHDFPNPWFGTIPPTCRRCGTPAGGWTITSSGSTTFLTNEATPTMNKIAAGFVIKECGEMPKGEALLFASNDSTCRLVNLN